MVYSLIDNNCLTRLTRQAILLVLLLLPFHLKAAPQHAHAQHAHIQVLASSCAACHGTGGNSAGGTPVLAGLDRGYFNKQMLAFRTGDRASTVMHHHARGLTLEEIDLLGEYFSRQARRPARKPTPSPQ